MLVSYCQGVHGTRAKDVTERKLDLKRNAHDTKKEGTGTKFSKNN